MMGSKHVELEPRLWGKLPGEVLEAVFARMPTDAICRLRVLSKAWKTAASTYSTFTRLCAEIQPSLYALLCELSSSESEPPWESTARYGARFFDATTCKWMHPFRLRVDHVWKSLDSDAEFETASDGGLVCFVNSAPSEDDIEPVVVCNPLTGEWRELPLHPSEEFKQLKKVELRVDRKTGDYEIILVAYSGLCYFDVDERSCYGVAYSSRTNEWRALSEQDSRTRVLFTDDIMESSYVCDITAQQFRPFDIRTLEVSDLDHQLLSYEAHWNNLYVVKKVLTSTQEFKANVDWMRNGDGSLVDEVDNSPADEPEFSRYTLSIYEDGSWAPGFDSDSSASFRARPAAVYNLIGVEPAADGPRSTMRWFFSRAFLMILCSPFREDHQLLMLLYDMEKGKRYCKFDRSQGATVLPIDGCRTFSLACQLRWDARP